VAKITRSYLAGLIDARGRFGFYSTGSTPVPFIEVKMTSIEIVALLHHSFGGSLMECKTSPGHKRRWHWRVQSRKALVATKTIYPFLLMKRKGAELILSHYRQL